MILCALPVGDGGQKENSPFLSKVDAEKGADFNDRHLALFEVRLTFRVVNELAIHQDGEYLNPNPDQRIFLSDFSSLNDGAKTIYSTVSQKVVDGFG